MYSSVFETLTSTVNEMFNATSLKKNYSPLELVY
jgi:hypothetical protein